MCGILGIVGNDPRSRERFRQALTLLAHRGPDGEGIWQDDDVLLGHRRLAIIDLSREADQPMIDSESGVVLVFNGEIYNYLEVRTVLTGEGVTFRTVSDSEVLLKAYLHWGQDMLSRLNGMFAFIVYDPRHKTVFVARDRFGVKPFYYAMVRGAFCFASEPKALLALDPALAEPDVQSIYDFLAHSQSFIGANTFFTSIHSLPPGHCATYKLGDRGLTTRPYWTYPQGEPASQSPEAALEEFTALFESAVRLRLRSDVPVGITLSGGLDSSAILASTVGQETKDFECFTSVYSGTERGEEMWAAKAAALAGRKLTSVVANMAEWYDTLQKVIWHMDAPGFSPAVFPLWRIMEEARKNGVPVLLEGQGADELLAGYTSYMPRQTRRIVHQMLRGRSGPGELIAHLRGSSATFGATNTLLWHLRTAMGSHYGRYQDRFGRRRLFTAGVTSGLSQRAPRDLPTKGRDVLFASLMRDHGANVLPPLLHYGDAVSMAHGIEARTPFLDYRLVEWVFKTEPPLVRSGHTKWPVRAYLDSKGFGAIAARREKVGYTVPLGNGIQAQSARLVREMISDNNAPLWNYLDRREVNKLFTAVLSSSNIGQTFHFYKIIALHMWLQNLAALRTMPLHRVDSKFERPASANSSSGGLMIASRQ